ncbi:transglycosylase SLT domain-containing protein [Qipengyuania sp.]|uniref:transglycosylase SLT domain-containing protein n=1 Tax=Qipengyuania sp. TaxID=2004515 RepID=UPI0035C7D1B1
MPTIAGPSPSTAPRPIDAIQHASRRTGVDFGFLIAEAHVESAMNPTATARTSSAAGLFQFTSGTWLDTLDKFGSEHGLGWASAAIERRNGRAFVADPAMRQQLLDLRFDPGAASLMAGALAKSNAAVLTSVLGRQPDQTELYLAHFLGSAGASKFLKAHAADPAQSAAALLPSAAEANTSIFFTGGRARSLEEVRGLMASKLERAPDFAPQFAQSSPPSGASPFGSPGFPSIAMRPGEQGERPPMSQLLQSTFGAGNQLPGRAGRHVAAAYNKIAGAGL